MEFDDRVKQTVAGFAEQGLNAALYYKNPDFRKFISLVPTSAVSGEGIPDLLLLLIQLSQNMMTDRLLKLTSLQCTILEVKVIEGFGYTVDVILANGILREGDRIMLCGWNGPIITTVRALLTPQPMKEIRFKSQYIHHKEVRAAQGVKISAQDLEGAVAGSQLYVINDIEEDEDAMEDLKETVMEDVKGLLEKLDRSGVGVTVQASTLGSLEALLEYLNKTCKVPVANINIGPVHKRDVVKASVMHDRKAPEFACILAFDVKVTPEAEQFAQDMKVRTFEADIIYHLFDKFTRYWEDVKKEKLANAKVAPVFPCILRIYEEYIFNKRNPIILGVHVEDGILKVGTPICVPTKEVSNSLVALTSQCINTFGSALNSAPLLPSRKTTRPCNKPRPAMMLPSRLIKLVNNRTSCTADTSSTMTCSTRRLPVTRWMRSRSSTRTSFSKRRSTPCW